MLSLGAKERPFLWHLLRFARFVPLSLHFATLRLVKGAGRSPWHEVNEVNECGAKRAYRERSGNKRGPGEASLSP